MRISISPAIGVWSHEFTSRATELTSRRDREATENGRETYPSASLLAKNLSAKYRMRYSLCRIDVVEAGARSAFPDESPQPKEFQSACARAVAPN